jgi:hypothetical protein
VLVEVAVVGDRSAAVAAFALPVADVIGRFRDDGLDAAAAQKRAVAAAAVGLVAQQRFGSGACPAACSQALFL